MLNKDLKNRYRIIPMTRMEEDDLTINYNSFKSIYGNIFIATTVKGVCYIGLGDEERMLKELNSRYGNAVFINKSDNHQTAAIAQIATPGANNEISFHIKGTDFQLKVWSELLNIPQGVTCSYKYIAEKIGRPFATRAVGTAIGQNPVTFLIPCHRVIRSDGTLGGYYWGLDIKKKILQQETVS